MLEAAGGDPLRAQDMEARLSEEWWERWLEYRRRMQERQESAAASAPATGGGATPNDGRQRGRRPMPRPGRRIAAGGPRAGRGADADVDVDDADDE